jgi:hypothetical protein
MPTQHHVAQDAAIAAGMATPWPACTTGDEGAHPAHHAEEGKEADSFWGSTALGAVRSSRSRGMLPVMAEEFGWR